VRQGEAINQCRSGTETVTSDEIGKGHLNVANVNVIHVACLSARRYAESGRGRDVLDDVFAGLTLAHRVGTGGFLFARLLECHGELRAFQTLARILPGLERAALEDLSRRLEVLPTPEPASAAIGPESRFILGLLRTKLMAIGPVVDSAGWAELGFEEMAYEQEDAAVTVGEEIQSLLAAGWTWNGDKLVHPGDKDCWMMYRRIDANKIRSEQFERELEQAVREARRKQGGGK
jgi:hypothetical protein